MARSSARADSSRPGSVSQARQPHDDARERHIIQLYLLEEALQATIVRGNRRAARKTRGQMTEIDGPRDQNPDDQNAEAFQTALPQRQRTR